VKHLHPSINYHSSGFEVKPTCPFGHGISSDNIISSTLDSTLRGSPSPAVRTVGNLVGRGIANPVLSSRQSFSFLFIL
jgi:hypothetical protein